MGLRLPLRHCTILHPIWKFQFFISPHGGLASGDTAIIIVTESRAFQVPVGSLPVPRFSDRYSFLQGCDRQPGTAGGITEAKISNLQSPPRTAAGSALHRHDQGVCHFWPLARIISFFILQCISDPSHWRGPFGASCPLSTTERHVAHWTIPARALRPWRCYRRDDVVTPWESSLRLALTSTVVISIHTVLRPVSDGDRSKAAAQYDRNVMT